MRPLFVVVSSPLFAEYVGFERRGEGLQVQELIPAVTVWSSAIAKTLWLEEAEASGVRELKGFAFGIRKDPAAVAAALRFEWSNGQTEGQINCLKMLKRQMFGRANFDLLRARVLHVA